MNQRMLCWGGGFPSRTISKEGNGQRSKLKVLFGGAIQDKSEGIRREVEQRKKRKGKAGRGLKNEQNKECVGGLGGGGRGSEGQGKGK